MENEKSEEVQRERGYPDVVVFAVGWMLDTRNDSARAIDVVAALFPDVIDDERRKWLWRDVSYLLEEFGEALRAAKSEARGEIVRGALR